MLLIHWSLRGKTEGVSYWRASFLRAFPAYGLAGLVATTLRTVDRNSLSRVPHPALLHYDLGGHFWVDLAELGVGSGLGKRVTEFLPDLVFRRLSALLSATRIRKGGFSLPPRLIQ